MADSVTTALSGLRRSGRWFFGVPIRRQTYRNIGYLVLAFPLGIAYFTFVVTSLATSVALLILVVGLPLLAFTLFSIAELAAFERYLAERLLGVSIPTTTLPETNREWLWRLGIDRSPWLGGLYLLSKFVIGIVAFVLLVVGATFTYTLVAAPLHYRDETVGIHVADPIEFIPVVSYQHNGWTLDLVSPFTIAIADGELVSLTVDSLGAALVVSAVGILVGLLTLHLFNAVAWLLGRYTALVLGGTRRSAIGAYLIWGDEATAAPTEGGEPTREPGRDAQAGHRADDPDDPFEWGVTDGSIEASGSVDAPASTSSVDREQASTDSNADGAESDDRACTPDGTPDRQGETRAGREPDRRRESPSGADDDHAGPRSSSTSKGETEDE